MKSFPLQGFQDRTLLLPNYDCSYKREFTNELIESKVKPGPIIEMNSVGMIRRCAIGGIGIAIIPEIFVRDEIASRHLHVIPWPETALEKAVMMIRHKDPRKNNFHIYASRLQAIFARSGGAKIL
jgi:DNA-binding transcriptional LysR family regulator